MEKASFPPRSKRSKPRVIIWGLFIFTLMIFLCAGSFLLWMEKQPSREKVDPEISRINKPIVMYGQLYEKSAVIHRNQLMLPLRFVQDQLDPVLDIDEAAEAAVVTSSDITQRSLRSDELTEYVKQAPVRLQFPVQRIEEEFYMPWDVLELLYRIVIEESDETGAVIVRKADDLVQWGVVKSNIPLRLGGDLKESIVYEMAPGTLVEILNETDQGWYHLQLNNGHVGYAPKSDIQLKEVERVDAREREEVNVPWRPTGGKVNLTWDPIYSRNPEIDAREAMPGVNVISPSWFRLKDGEGNLANQADLNYVQWAHDQGYQVWALFSNDFDPDKTAQALSTSESRANMIRQLLIYAELYQLQGINIDFENVYLEDKDLVTQFVRELTSSLHKQGLTVSMDVTVRGGSAMWSLFYDRRALSDIVDYMIVMAYDEHWAASPIAGSVSSLPWAEKGIADIIREDGVPPEKLVLGVPFYTRLWTERLVDGQIEVSSKTLSMNDVERIVEEKKLTPVYLEKEGQFYVEYQDGASKQRIWIEDERSMKARIELVKKYQLGGVASWRRGFERPEIWHVIKETLEK